MVIGITGKKRHGKDTIANYIVEKYGATKFAFADEVKYWVNEFNPLLDCGDGECSRLKELLEHHTLEELKEHEVIGPQLREYWQTTGTEIGRERLDNDIWVNLTFKQIESSGVDLAVVSDMRFLNESERVMKEGGLTVRVINPRIKDDGDTHASETEMDQIWVHETIINQGTLEDLHRTIDGMMTDRGLINVQKMG